MIRIGLIYAGRAFGLMVGLPFILSVLSGTSYAQEEVTSKIYRYRERVATGYYEGYEVSPRRQRARIAIPGTPRGLFPFGAASAAVRLRSRLPDSHRGLRFYERSTCIECHPKEARDLHSTRAGITCRQCHGPEPIAAIDHYYSPMNSIRRYAYICSKCHEGANVNFASFYVHEPPAGTLETWETFPVLFIAYWGMLLLLVGTLAFFVPHALMVGIRELTDTRAFIVPRRFMVSLGDLSKKFALSMPHFFRTGLGRLFRKKGTGEDEVDNAH